MNSIDRLHEAHSDPADFAREYIRYLSGVLAQIDTAAIGAFAEALLAARERGATVYFIGNGGSAATASHFANDLAIGTRSSGRPFRVMSLADNVPVLTAVANDFGYAEIFLRQLQVMLLPGDVVVAISASGNSPNLLNAIEYANGAGAITIGLTGFDGGRLREIAHLAVHVPTPAGEYGPVEDAHMVLDHLVGNFLRLACAREANGR